MSWLTRLKKSFNKSQEEPASIEAVEVVYEPSPFAALIETPEEITPDINANVKDVFVITDATPSEPDTLGIINTDTMEIRVRDAVSGEFNTVYRWQGPAIEEYIPIWGDWAGSGITSLGLYHPGSGHFNLFSGLDCSDLLYRLTLDQKGHEWRPIARDWDGDGSDGIGLYHPETGTFLLCNQLDNPQAIVETHFKNENHRSGDVAISGDWNGDGLDEVGVYNAIHGEFTLFESLEPGCKSSVYPAHKVKPEWSPLTGDWRGIGFDSIGLYDNEGGVFYLLNAADDQDPEIVLPVNTANGNWRPLALKGFTAPATGNDSQALPTEPVDGREEASVVEKVNGLIKAKKHAEALNAVDQALQVNRDSGQLLLIRGKLVSRLKRYDLAEISFQNALSKNVDSIEALIELGGLAEAQSKWDKALLYWDLCIPKTKQRKQKFGLLTAKGDALCKLGSYDKAEKVYQVLIKNFSGQFQGWFGLAHIARLKGDWHSAKSGLQDCVKRFPNYRLKTNWMLQIAECMLELDEFEEACAIYSGIPGKHPGYIKALEALADRAMESKQWDRAIEYYNKCSSLLPINHNRVLQWRLSTGELMIKSGRHDEAEVLFQELLKIYPSNARVKKDCETIQALTGC
jgi:endoglucanase